MSVGTESSSVNRTFNDANQLLVATDTEEDTTNFYYDNNGNLTTIFPPGVNGANLSGAIQYGFNQRNLLITNSTHISGTGWVSVAEFYYDGDSKFI